MKSSNFLSNSAGFALCAIYMPLAVLSALIFLLHALLPVPFSPFPILISAGIIALAASVYCDFLKDTKSSRIAADIRGALIVIWFGWIFTSLFRWGIPWKKRFLPDIAAVLASIGALYVWTSVIALKQLFSIRCRIESFMVMYRGEELHAALFDEISLLQYSGEAIASIRRKYIFQLIIIGLLTLICAANGVRLSPAVYILLCAVLFSGIGILSFLGIMQWEHRCAAEGMASAPVERLRRMLWIGLFSALALSAALLCAHNKSLLPFSALTGLFGKFLGLFRNIFSPIKIKSGSETFEAPVPEPMYPFPDQMEKGEPSPFWNWLQYGLIIIAAAVFIRFMIAPLLHRIKAMPGALTFRQRLHRIFAEWFRGIEAALSAFFAFIKQGKNRQKLRKPSAENIQLTAQSVLAAYSRAKRRAIKQSATLFAKLIMWGGEACHVAWKPAHAPGEYCGLLAVSAPDGTPANIIRCGELFEQALYSAEILSRAERKEFKSLVEGIIAQR